MPRSLEDFRDEILPWMHGCTEVIEHRDYGKLLADVIYREGIFQVERVTMAPNAVVRAHRHPNIDAYEQHVSGSLAFIANNDPARVNRILERIRTRSAKDLDGICFLVRSADWHGAKAGPEGACFLSVQKWTGDVPVTAAGVDWEGPCI